MEIRQDYSLLSHNTFGVDARCRAFAEYATEEELQTFVRTHANALNDGRVLHIGGGSNLLFTRDFDGLILHSAIRGIETSAPDGDGRVLLRVGAGEVWDELVEHCTAEELYGLENLSLIPGEVGAAAVQNIGAYGSEAGDFITEVETVSLKDGTRRTFSVSECRYGYRKSIFKEELRGQYAVTRVTLRLSTTFRPDLTYAALARAVEDAGQTPATLTAAALRQIVIDVRRSKLPDPAETGSAGSFFMNPVIPHDQAERLLTEHPDMPHFDVEGGVKVPAGWLIDRCGWKGRSLGRAGVYPKQALVLVNNGGATGREIVALSDAIRDDVFNKFGIIIHPEVNFL